MLSKNFILLMFLAIGFSSWAQQKTDAIADIRKGNKEFAAEKFAAAEISYRKALEKDPQNKEAIYNLGTAQYQQKKFNDAIQSFNKSTELYKEDKKIQAAAYHNLGNAYLMEKKADEAIKAYKEALKRNPSDLDTKHNLLLAMKDKQQQQQQQQQNKQSNQDKKDQDKDGKGNNQDKQDGKGKDDNKNNGSKNGDGKQGDNESDKNGNADGGKEPQERKGQMSQEQAEKLLEALQNEEKKTQAKMLQLKGKPKPVKTEKDW